MLMPLLGKRRLTLPRSVSGGSDIPKAFCPLGYSSGLHAETIKSGYWGIGRKIYLGGVQEYCLAGRAFRLQLRDIDFDLGGAASLPKRPHHVGDDRRSSFSSDL